MLTVLFGNIVTPFEIRENADLVIENGRISTVDTISGLQNLIDRVLKLPGIQFWARPDHAWPNRPCMSTAVLQVM